jgi:DNA-binding NarL/FixJ family response regulator
MVRQNPIQVLLSDMPPLLLEIVAEALATQPDLHVLGSVGREESLLEAVKRTNADLVVASDHNLTSEQCRKVLYAQSRLKVIELDSRDGLGRLYQLRLSRIALGEMSTLELPNAIRASVRPISGCRWRSVTRECVAEESRQRSQELQPKGIGK